MIEIHILAENKKVYNFYKKNQNNYLEFDSILSHKRK